MAVIAVRQVVADHARLALSTDDDLVADDVDRRAELRAGQTECVGDIGVLDDGARAGDVDRVDVVVAGTVHRCVIPRAVGRADLVAEVAAVGVGRHHDRIRRVVEIAVVPLAERAGAGRVDLAVVAVLKQPGVDARRVLQRADDHVFKVAVAVGRGVHGHPIAGPVRVRPVAAVIEDSAVDVGAGDEHVGREHDGTAVAVAGVVAPDAEPADVLNVDLVPVAGRRIVGTRGVVRQRVVVRHQQPVARPIAVSERIRHRRARGAELQLVPGDRLARRRVLRAGVGHADHDAVAADRHRGAERRAGVALQSHFRAFVPGLGVGVAAVNDRLIGVRRADDHAQAVDVDISAEAADARLQRLRQAPRQALADVDVDPAGRRVGHHQRARGGVVVADCAEARIRSVAVRVGQRVGAQRRVAGGCKSGDGEGAQAADVVALDDVVLRFVVAGHADHQPPAAERDAGAKAVGRVVRRVDVERRASRHGRGEAARSAFAS